MAVSFIGGGNLNTQRKPPTVRKSLPNFITLCYIALINMQMDMITVIKELFVLVLKGIGFLIQIKLMSSRQKDL